MTPPEFRFASLEAGHDRSRLRCGDEALDRYFQSQATQDVRRRVTNCFVVIHQATSEIAAFYTLSAASIPFAELPHDEAKRLPRYPTVPAVRIGRLAVALRFQRRGLGELMLMDAAYRSMQDAAAAYAILVDAKNETAVEFYRRFGFRQFSERRMSLFLPLAKARLALIGR
jgi:ribosomal protein S18 acetylase RimI-like enzyme